MEGQNDFSPIQKQDQNKWIKRAATAAAGIRFAARLAGAAGDDLAVPVLQAINPEGRPAVEAVTPSSFIVPTKEATNPTTINGNPPEGTVQQVSSNEKWQIVDTRTGEVLIHKLPDNFVHTFPKKT